MNDVLEKVWWDLFWPHWGIVLRSAFRNWGKPSNLWLASVNAEIWTILLQNAGLGVDTAPTCSLQSCYQLYIQPEDGRNKWQWGICMLQSVLQSRYLRNAVIWRAHSEKSCFRSVPQGLQCTERFLMWTWLWQNGGGGGVVIICCAVDDVIHYMACSSELTLGWKELLL